MMNDVSLLFSIQFYNDFEYDSGFREMRPSSTERQILSTSNTMMIYYWSGSGSHRGIKARYSRVLPACKYDSNVSYVEHSLLP